MEYLTLNNGTRMPLVGFGTFMLGGEACTNAVKEAQNQELLDFTARRLMEMAADIIMCHLLIQDASKAADLFSKSAHVYLNFAEAEVTKHTNFVKNMDKEDLAFYKK